jgi:S1-C subfamily serine protease
MPEPSVLSQFSQELSELAAGARSFLADVRSRDGHQLSGVLWKSDAVVVSEQALPDAAEYEVRIGDDFSNASVAGRDQGTNVAVLKLEKSFAGARPPPAVPAVGALALALGAGVNGVVARLTMVRSVGGAWQSQAGGTIDHRITLDRRLGATEEGGPVLAADGSIFGISTRGAWRQSLVIPASTIERATVLLLEKGSIERGWLGVSLHPVALPETLKPDAVQRVGLMVMEVIAEGPAAKAGVLTGDILLTVGGSAATRPLKVARQLGADSIGKMIEIRLARTGAILTCQAAIEARKSG